MQQFTLISLQGQKHRECETMLEEVGKCSIAGVSILVRLVQSYLVIKSSNEDAIGNQAKAGGVVSGDAPAV